MSEVLVVMYHHVHGPAAAHLAGLHGVEQDDFRAQLQALKRTHVPIAYPALRDALDKGETLPERSVLITFDDGTIDHYRCAFPILAEEGFSGLFFVIGKATTEGKLTQVHLRHLLDRALGRGALKPRFIRAMRARGLDEAIFARFPEETVRKAYRWDDAETARFKYAVNFGMAPEVRNGILTDLIETHLETPVATLGREFYITWDQAREMEAAGMSIGGHSYDHEALALLEPEALTRDLTACRDRMARELGDADGRGFSYPYGKAQHYNASVIEVLKRLGFRDCFANIQGTNRVTAGTVDVGRYHWRRIDPKDLPAITSAG